MTSSVKPTTFPVMLAQPAGPELTSQSLGTSRKTRKTILGLAVTQLTLAVIVILWLIILLVCNSVLEFRGFLSALSVVIFLLITGSAGITASKISSPCWLITFLIMCILSALFTFAVLGLYSGGLVYDVFHYQTSLWKGGCDYSDDPDDRDYSDDRDDRDYSHDPDDSGYSDCFENIDHMKRLVIVMYALVLIFFFVEMLIALIASAFSCHALCRCCRGRPEMQVAYVMENGYAHQLKVPPPAGADPNYSPVLQTKDMYPMDIPLEHCDVSPTGSRPPSYVSIEGSGEKKEEDCSKTGIVENV